MRNIGALITHKRLIGEQTLTASPSAVVIDRGSANNQRSEGLSLGFYVGAGGITFTGTNYLALKMEESDDGSTYNVVSAAPVAGQGGGGVVRGPNAGAAFGQEPDANGFVRLINAAKASADTDPFKVDYVGNKRYVRATIVFGGTHISGTPVALWGVLGYPDLRPPDMQAIAAQFRDFDFPTHEIHMKTIKMLRDMNVSRNGCDVERWSKDQIIDDCPDALAADLTHDQTLAAIEVTGDKKADAKAETDASDELAKREADAKAAAALDEAAKQAALDAARGVTGKTGAQG